MRVLLKRWVRGRNAIALDLASGIGLFWLFVEMANYSTNSASDVYLKNVPVFIGAFVVALVGAALKNKPATSFGYSLRGKDNRLEIRVGDIFKNPGALVIPVNDHFDMSLGGNVFKAPSIQNQVIQKYYAGKVEHLNTDISALVTIGAQYDIGKTIEVEQTGKKFYLVVNSVKQTNNRVKSEIDDFVSTLNGLWQYVALSSSRDVVLSIPVINTQHGRDSYLSRAGAIKEIITSYVEASKSLNICDRLVVSILPTDLAKSDIDLDELDEFLRYSCRHFRQLTLSSQPDDQGSSAKIIRIDN
jgi:hypothetical protein